MFIAIIQTYIGLMLEIPSPVPDSTHSLFMNRPVGWVQVRPLGDVS